MKKSSPETDLKNPASKKALSHTHAFCDIYTHRSSPIVADHMEQVLQLLKHHVFSCIKKQGFSSPAQYH